MARRILDEKKRDQDKKEGEESEEKSPVCTAASGTYLSILLLPARKKLIVRSGQWAFIDGEGSI